MTRKRGLNNKGESIMEAIVAVLVAAMGTAVITGFILAARHASYGSDVLIHDFYTAESGLEAVLSGEEESLSGISKTDATLTITREDGSEVSIPVTFLEAGDYEVRGFEK